MRRTAALVATLGIASVGLAQERAARVIAAAGDPTPDGSAAFTRFRCVAIDNGGRFVFSAALSSRNAESVAHWGTYAGSGERRITIAETGDPLGETDEVYATLECDLNEVGDGVFRMLAFSDLSPKGARYHVVAWDGDSLRSIASGEDPAPGTDGVIRYPGYVTINDAGRIAFWTTIVDHTTGSSGEGVMIDESDGPRFVFRTGDPAPRSGTPLLAAGTPELNNAGALAIALALPNDGFAARGGLWLIEGDIGGYVVNAGDPAPGGGVIEAAGSPSLSDGGEAAFIAYVDESGSDNQRRAVMYADGSRIVQAARDGAPAPGGGSFDDPDSVRVNDTGRLVFFSRTDATYGDWGLYSWSNAESVQRVVGTGDALLNSVIAPVDESRFGLYWSYDLNDSGELAFAAELESGEEAVVLTHLPNTSPCVLADFDRDGVVGSSDLATMIARWGGRAGDMNGDGVTGADDVAALLGLWGPCPAMTPEATTP